MPVPQNKTSAWRTIALQCLGALLVSLCLYAGFYLVVMLIISRGHHADSFNDFSYPWPTVLGDYLISIGGKREASWFIETLMALQFFLYAVVVVAGRAMKVRAWAMIAIVGALHLTGIIYLLAARTFTASP